MLSNFDNKTIELIDEMQRFVKEKKNYNNLIKLFPQPIFYKDEKGVFIDCNIAFLKLTKSSREEILGKKLKDFRLCYLDKESEKTDLQLLKKEISISIAEITIIEEQKKLFIIKQAFYNEETKSTCIVGFNVAQAFTYEQVFEYTIRKKDTDIKSYALKLESSANFLQHLKYNIQTSTRNELVGKKTLQSLERSIDSFLKSEFFVSPLTQQLNETNSTFYKSLQETYPKLTTLDMKICALVRMQIHTKEIADILSVNGSSVDMSLYRIRQKMGIKGKGSLQKTLLSL